MEAESERIDPSAKVVTLRLAVFFALWLVLIGTAPKDWPFGLVAAIAATAAGLRLWPASGGFDALGTARFVLRFLPQSVMAGIEVARHAFAPRIGLRPGYVSYRPVVAAGMPRRALCAVMSLQPGKLPVGLAPDGTLEIHCLDMQAPVLAEIAADEASFRAALKGEAGRG